MRKNRLLIVLFIGVTALFLASCTYDYFEDETNYQLFVPEVLNKTVSDCRVLVYNNAGVLVGTRYATSPWDENPVWRQVYSVLSYNRVSIRCIAIPIRTVSHLWMNGIWVIRLLS